MTAPCSCATDTRARGPDLAGILGSIGQAAYEWDVGSDDLRWSGNAGTLLGVEPGRIATGRAYAELLDPASPSCRFDAIAGAATDPGAGVAFGVEYGLRPAGPSGPLLWIEDCGRWFGGADGRPARAVGVVRIVNDRHARDADLVFRSRFDPLTGELNRTQLAEVVDQRLADARRFRSSFGFLLAAIDNLAVINAAYGFDVADEVIAAVAKRIRGRMRAGDMLGRFSGNKFGLVLQNCTPEELAVAAERLIEATRSDVVRCTTGPVAATISLGGVVAPRHARSTVEVFARAQEALDAAKLRRRGSFVAYAPSLERDVQRRDNARLTDTIVGALTQRRVALAFQRVVRADTGGVAFHEALMRLHDGDGCLLDGAQVVPVAERLGLVRLIDHRVLDLALDELATDAALHLSVNVSPSSILDREWSDLLSAGLRRKPGVARRLVVEITESAAVRDIDATRGFVTRVKDLGCRVAIDDFGAGYSSFRNLRDLGVDMVKIDGGFVARMAVSADDRAFVRALLDLARQLELETVAEWVQDEAVAQALVGLGCDYLQGALYGMAEDRRTPAA